MGRHHGGFINGHKAEVYLSPTGGEMVSTSIDLENGTYSNFSIPLITKGERFLGKLNARNSFLYLAAAKKDPVFHVYIFKWSPSR